MIIIPPITNNILLCSHTFSTRRCNRTHPRSTESHLDDLPCSMPDHSLTFVSSFIIDHLLVILLPFLNLIVVTDRLVAILSIIVF